MLRPTAKAIPIKKFERIGSDYLEKISQQGRIAGFLDEGRTVAAVACPDAIAAPVGLLWKLTRAQQA